MKCAQSILLGLLVCGAAISSAQYDGEYGDDYGGGGGYGGGGYGGGGGGYGGDYGDGGDYGPDPITQTPGVIDLDDMTFSKVITGKYATFVAIYDGEAPSKDFFAEFQTLSEEFGPHNTLMLAKVSADESPKTAKKLGISEFPAVLFYEAGSKTFTTYDGEQTAAAMGEFLIEKAGPPGAVEALSPILAEFLAEGADLTAALAKAEATVKTLDEDLLSAGQYYVKVFKNMIKKGMDYPAKEFERLHRLISSDSLRDDKIDEFKSRTAILKVFDKTLKDPEPEVEEEDEEEEEPANEEL
ncbi:hypothetical protein CYMTET_50210 [Cymbomonas tetramitiformis]|uniref:Protein disulfide isomerase n=1 Tax=Cymbomonas tetramitiformis TaxID=36881 RepID=A0AAE0EUZ5_9CHLO|nr:hypothetical protein CYMTET_50210 [Cymbomonas tetramitiformis]|eukprot:gene2979-3796_t